MLLAKIILYTDVFYQNNVLWSDVDIRGISIYKGCEYINDPDISRQQCERYKGTALYCQRDPNDANFSSQFSFNFKISWL